MTFCKLHSEPITSVHQHTDENGNTAMVKEVIGWTEPAIIRTISNGRTGTSHILECSTPWPMPNGDTMDVHCCFTAAQMRQDRLEAGLPVLPYDEGTDSAVTEETPAIAVPEAAA